MSRFSFGALVPVLLPGDRSGMLWPMARRGRGSQRDGVAGRRDRPDVEWMDAGETVGEPAGGQDRRAGAVIAVLALVGLAVIVLSGSGGSPSSAL